MKRFFSLLIITLLASQAVFSQEPDRNIVYAVDDNQILGMDLYAPQDTAALHPCVIFIYGGGFSENNQKAETTRAFCRRLADDGFVAFAIDYRLGLAGFVSHGLMGMIRPTQNAVRMATEDLFRALDCILKNASDLKVDPTKIILVGSSAGAITALQADYELGNRTPMTAQIPEEFRFAGVASFAGAIFSSDGRVKYRVHAPAPTFFLHGTADRLVTYKSISFFKLGFYGTNALVKRFEKAGYPYVAMRFKDEGHVVSIKMLKEYDALMWFIRNMAFERKNFRVDLTFNDVDREQVWWDRIKPEGVYK
jgi:dienelactone hydrolase